MNATNGISVPKLLRAMATGTDARDKGHDIIFNAAADLIDELVGALSLAHGYVAKVHGSLSGAVGPDNIVKNDLDKIEAALTR